MFKSKINLGYVNVFEMLFLSFAIPNRSGRRNPWEFLF